MVTVCYLLAGLVLKAAGMVFRAFYAESGEIALPKITQIVLSLSGWGGTVPLMLGLGVLVALGLEFVVRRDHLRAHFPIALSMAWMLVVMIIVSAFFAILLPLMQMGPGEVKEQDGAGQEAGGLQVAGDLKGCEHDEPVVCASHSGHFSLLGS